MSYPKKPRQRNPTLLNMAKGEPCLLRVPGVCNGDSDTTVAAHSNQSAHGKGKAMKATKNNPRETDAPLRGRWKGWAHEQTRRKTNPRDV